jgi:hypothetical protein
MEQKEQNEIKKIFFITSNQSKIDKYIRYEIYRNYDGITNLKACKSICELRQERTYKRENFSVYLNSVEIFPNNLKKEDIDPTTKRYKNEIRLKYNKAPFPGNLSFKHDRNNFIYDFKFNEYHGWGKIYDPPPQIKFSKLEQLKIYMYYLNDVLKKNIKDQIYKDLIIDSKSAYFGKKVDLDFILEILKVLYEEKEIKLFLKSIKIENIQLTMDFNYKDYETILRLI